jgi:hypothetical protein
MIKAVSAAAWSFGCRGALRSQIWFEVMANVTFSTPLLLKDIAVYAAADDGLSGGAA